MRLAGRQRPPLLSVALILVTITCGLMLRRVPMGLPFVIVKYGGSALWALMIYWIVSAVAGRAMLVWAALLSLAIASGVEAFKLHHSPALDAFRLTLPGALLLGRVFSAWDLLAYALAIGAGLLADRSIRMAHGLAIGREAA